MEPEAAGGPLRAAEPAATRGVHGLPSGAERPLRRRDITAWLARWSQAGILDDRQIAAILAFEAGEDGARRVAQARVSLQEVVAYAGVAITLAGVALAIGLHYDQLGIGGRLAVYAAVSAVAFLAAHQLSGHAGAAKRASAVCVTVGILGCGALVGDAAATIGLFTRREHVVVGPPGETDTYDEVHQSGNAALGLAVVTVLAVLTLLRRASVVVGLTVVGAAFATTYVSFHAAGGSSATGAGLIGLLPGAMLIALAQRPHLAGSPAGEALRTFAVLVPVAALYAVGGDAPAAGFAALGGILSLAALLGALRLGSTGLAVAGGLGLFGLVVDVVSRYFADALGAPIVFVASGLALIGAALLIHRIVRAKRPRGAGVAV